MHIFKTSKALVLALTVNIFGVAMTDAQSLPTGVANKIQTLVVSSVPESMGIGKVNVNSVVADRAMKTVSVDLSESYSDVPFTQSNIEALKSAMKAALPAEYVDYEVAITIAGSSIDNYLPMFSQLFSRNHDLRFITKVDETSRYTKGLDGDIIALWQSHGWYFEPKLNRWEWQRARIFQTVEDLYTQSYVMPYLMPMLENAGAYVMSPRERDVNEVEVIVDNDGNKAQDLYTEHNNGEKWKKGKGKGFAYSREQYEGFANPFIEGTFRYAKTSKDKSKISVARWGADIPKDGTYAVYISYNSQPNSVADAVYKVNSEAGEQSFIVNQQMGGGTWIYLGHFPLKKGVHKNVVELLNYSQTAGGVVTADAVKIGGGMGNIARKVEGLAENVKSSDAKPAEKVDMPDIDYRYQLSNHPRYTEGARYFLQWAGIPDSVYSPSQGVNDYTDDYRCRGLWVNYMAGGSKVLPDKGGLKIPVDLAFAFHSDAGTTMNDDIIGTLGIYYTNKFDKYADGTPRNTSRLLTNSIMTNIVSDVRRQYEPNWTRRGMWDKSYYEARVPEVPTMLLELLSHQNFADMKYGLDPNFRFTVSRAIYKGMAEFLAKRDGRELMIQPLPVNSFAITKSGDNKFLLTWKATPDTLCAKADASRYVIYERVGNGAFKQLAVVNSPQYMATINDHKVHSYKIEAMNDGGRSFPSETLACGVASNSEETVLVVNGFTRVSAPDTFDAGKIAGFYDEKDHGVPYIKDISFIGSQFEFRRDIPWMDDDAAGFGASRSNYETKVIAGNTFDYPAIHGEAILKAGHSFVSSGLDAVTSGEVNMNKYPIVDLILGKQKETAIGRGAMPSRYKAFPPELREAITAYCQGGGDIFVSGAFVATDIWDKKQPSDEEKKFAQEVLGYNWRVGQASLTGEVYPVPTEYHELDSETDQWQFSNQLNEEMYCVESPDALYPADTKTSATFLRYRENNLPAGVATSKGGYKTCVAGFPFETIKGEEGREEFMNKILKFFTSNDNK